MVDFGLRKMLASLLGKEPVFIANEKDCMLICSTTKYPEIFVQGIENAVKGMLGERLIDIQHTKRGLEIRYSYREDSDLISAYSCETDGQVNLSVAHKIEAKFADKNPVDIYFLPVEEKYKKELIQFVGNGTYEIRKSGNVFSFLNSGAVFCDAPEGSYIEWVKDDLFRVLEEKFEQSKK